MKKLYIAGLVLIVLIGGYWLMKDSQISPTSPVVSEEQPITQTVKVAVIKYDPDSKGAIKIGCSDEVLLLERPITPTTGVLRAAINELLALSNDPQFNFDSFDSWEKAYNTTGVTFVNRTRIDDATTGGTLEDVKIENGIAKLYFKDFGGLFTSGGVCDDPRISAQIYYTAMQFPTVNDIEVYLSGVLIGKGMNWTYFSQKG